MIINIRNIFSNQIDKRFYNILNLDDYYNIIINRYNNIINFIDNFIELMNINEDLLNNNLNDNNNINDKMIKVFITKLFDNYI